MLSRIACLVVLYATSLVCGDVIVKNDSGQGITLVLSSWTSAAGVEARHDATWNLDAGANTRLLYEDADIRAKTFRWRVRTANGETPEADKVWIQHAGADGHVRITISPREVAASAGRVRVVNTTTWPLNLSNCWYTDTNGVRQNVQGSWSFEPGESSYLLVGSNEFRARTFRASLNAGSHSTSWIWNHQGGDGEPLTVTIGYGDLGPSTTWTPKVTQASPAAYTFCATSRMQTIVFRLQNLSGRGDVDLFVKDARGRIVARCTYGGTHDDRCMLHVAEQGQYTIEVRAQGAGDPIDCKVSIACINHLDILGEVVVKEGVKMLIAGGILELIGDEKTKKDFWNETGTGLAKDAIALALVEMLMQVQREKPDIDPLSNDLASLVSKLRGDDRIVNVRGAFLDELMRRVRASCR